MTAEIALLNKSAVALAADSAVTIGGRKIYNSANKLFTMSKYHPVGIMIYGNAEIMGVPWETVIKLFRKELDDEKFDTIKEYGEKLIGFIETNRSIFPEQQQFERLQSNIFIYYNRIVKDIKGEIKTFIDSGKKVDEKITKDTINFVIKSHLKDWDKAKLLDNFDEQFVKDFIIKYKDVFDQLIKESFEKLPLSKVNKERLYYIGAYIFCKNRFPGSRSGVVIAGFGDKEIYPSMVDYDIDCLVENKLKYRKEILNIDSEDTAFIKPFAQQEMVHTFIEGIDPDLNKFANQYLKKIFEDYPKMIIENLPEVNTINKEDLNKKLTSASLILYDKYDELINEYRRKNHVNPILSIVEVLPKDELANMAETLVNLTSFKRKVTMVNETVGGPVDVAVISKGDGFIWIKRKHYFEVNLNQHFRENYYRKGECCEKE